MVLDSLDDCDQPWSMMHALELRDELNEERAATTEAVNDEDGEGLFVRTFSLCQH